MSFRPEIQALRAVAVGLVVVFHFWPDALPGGYVGVDVFFVISGYLITGSLWAEVARTGRVSLRDFWARRIRRLLPAASVVLVASLVLMLALVPRPLWQETVVQVGASALYVQNWVLAAGSVDYLAAEGTPTLVQHYWSLSVEEQFYLVWPLVLLLAVVLGRRRKSVVIGAFAVLAVGSFVYSVLLTGNPSGYFNTGGRAWEFALGGLLSFAPALKSRWMPLAGVALIAAAALLYSGGTPFPGATALLPVAGALLVIAGGANRVAAVRPLQFVGGISYSVYLWHWPLLVVLPVLGWWWPLVALPATLVLAWGTTRFVEAPLRRSIRRPYRLAVAAALVVVLAGTATWSTVQLGVSASAASAEESLASEACFGAAALVEDCASPFSAAGVDTAFAAQDRGILGTTPCNSNGTAVVRCEFGADDPVRTIAVVGNSHAGALIPGLEAYALEHDWRVVLFRKTDCLGVSTVDATGSGGQPCASWTRAVLDELVSSTEFDAVLFVSHKNALHYLTAAHPSAETEAALEDDISANLAAVEASGKAVVVVGDVPGTKPVPAPECVYRHGGRYDPCALPRSPDALEDANVESRAASATPGIRTFSLLPYLCGPTTCHSVIGGVVVYFDDHHLTATFSRTLAPYLGAVVEDALDCCAPARP
ncbi:MAG: Peptidoglycan/LPS O-acetylase OafA/YrhL, contains acyltransferase and SGNH-hydrolase domain [Rhodoglobus sp.]|nr:Peptidoglycan/LPS O-acetylase OafA/YrhL, contains acyltransferase and SGNH-hydrolase domain [Rhodoglobus sp.]